jgi:hypothetical protein
MTEQKPPPFQNDSELARLQAALDECEQGRRRLRKRLRTMVDAVSEAIFGGKKRKEPDSTFAVDEE